MSSESCTLCPDVFSDRYDLVAHKMKAHRPVPGQLFFARTVLRVLSNMGSGTWLYSLCDDEGTIAVVHELPEEVTFIEIRLAPSRIGAGTPVVVAYDPQVVQRVGW